MLIRTALAVQSGRTDEIDGEQRRAGRGAAWSGMAQRAPVPAAPFETDAGLSRGRAGDLPMFSLRRAVPEDPAAVARARLPAANVPAATDAPLGPPAAERGTEQTWPIADAPWWASLEEATDAVMVDFRYAAGDQPRGKHRRRFDAEWAVDDVDALPYTGGLIWDLRAQAEGGIDWTRARTVDVTAAPETTIDNDLVDELAERFGFTDKAILYELRWGVSNFSRLQRHAILSPHHGGAFEYSEQIDVQLPNEVKEGWLDGPYRYPPVWPFRMVPRSVVAQPKFHVPGIKYRIVVDLSWPHDGRAPNDVVDVDDEPELHMVKLVDFAAAVAVLRTSGETPWLFGIDLHAAYRIVAKRLNEQWVQTLLWFQTDADGRKVLAWYIDKRCTFGDAGMVHKFSRVSDFIVAVARGMLRQAGRHADPDEPHLRQYQERRRQLFPDEPEQADLFFNQMYIDDHMFVVLGGQRSSLDFDEVIRVTKQIMGDDSVQTEKTDRPSPSVLVQLGGVLDMDKQEIDRSPKFAAKYEAKIKEALEAGEWTFHEARAVTYLINHMAQFRPEHRPANAPLFAALRRWRHTGIRRKQQLGELRAVLEHWLQIGREPGGIPFFPAISMPERGHPWRIDVETDAAGEKGFGICLFPPGDDRSQRPVFVRGMWTEAERAELDINVKELIVAWWLITLLGELYPAHRVRMYVTEHIDNMVSVAVAQRNSSKRNWRLNELQRRRAREVKRTGWVVEQEYINTKKNVRADALSRGDYDTFRRSVAELNFQEPVEVVLDDVLRDLSFLL